ncbi:DMT family transporter [Psychromarinibacter sp. C21-152]|uniref:DMT family transporter n=1 Tax=Psychromarinibacter sediminicola TaxID=3033385 RepID=A0AAE3TAL5_9RHOB|nr:DMT family transporter [Psychromarinibacter sediminicola]
MERSPVWHAPQVLWARQSASVRGIVFMCLSTLFATMMHGLVRVVGQDLPAFEVAFFRNLFGLLILSPLLWQSRFRVLRTERVGLHALRGLANVLAMFLFFSSLTMIPLARVSALNFTAPIFMALMSIVFLGERFRFYRWAAIFAGFAGVLIILRPGFDVIDAGSLLVVASAAFWAVAMVFIKMLSRTESSLTIVAWMGITMCLFSFGPALWVWQTPTLEQLLLLMLVGFCGTVAQMAISQSLKVADPTAVLPFDFLKLIWATLIGVLFFAEVPDAFTWIGAAVIFSSGLAIAFREKRLSKPSMPPPRF